MGVAEKSSLLSKINDNKQVCESKYKVEKIGVKLHPTTERQSMVATKRNIHKNTKQKPAQQKHEKRMPSPACADFWATTTFRIRNSIGGTHRQW